jgi:hypothetical protein
MIIKVKHNGQKLEMCKNESVRDIPCTLSIRFIDSDDPFMS